MTGGEEDGVDNRVEALAKAPSESSDKQTETSDIPATGQETNGATPPAKGADSNGQADTDAPTVSAESVAEPGDASAADSGHASAADSGDVTATAEPGGAPAATGPAPESPTRPAPQTLSDALARGYPPAWQGGASADSAYPPLPTYSPGPTYPTGQDGSTAPTWNPSRPPGMSPTSPAQAAGAVGAIRGFATRVTSFTQPKYKPSKVRPAIGVRTGPAQRPVAGRPPAAHPQAPHPQGPRPQAAAPAQRRRAQLVIERIEPWSVMKFSFLISLVAWVVLFVVVAILYFALSKLGVFSHFEQAWNLATTSKSHPQSGVQNWFKASRVLGYTMLFGAVNVVLITALATVGAVVYNLITTLTGGIEVTLKESD